MALPQLQSKRLKQQLVLKPSNHAYKDLYRIDDVTHTEDGESEYNRFNELNHSKDSSI